MTLSVYEGELLCVVGSVGSGKSSLLSAMLGEMELLRGDVARVAGQVALVGQSAFILNASVRENVVFGRDFDAELEVYFEAARAAACAERLHCAHRPAAAPAQDGGRADCGRANGRGWTRSDDPDRGRVRTYNLVVFGIPTLHGAARCPPCLACRFVSAQRAVAKVLFVANSVGPIIKKQCFHNGS